MSGVLNIVHPSLLPTVTAEEPSAEEDRESQEEPDVAHDSQEKLCGRHARSVAGRVVFHGHDEESGDDREHPNSGPEMNLSKAELLS